MQVIIQPGKVSGTVQANASKSAMQRACAAALVRNGISVIHNPGISNDDNAALDIIKRLGAEVTYNEDGTITIDSAERSHIEDSIHCGESGLSIRMFTPIAALNNKQITITGEGSLATRPMDFFDAILPQLNVKCESNGGKLPLMITGPLQPKEITIDGSLSSQFLTGLLMAFAGYYNANAGSTLQPVTIHVDNLKSKPYIDLTLQLLRDFDLTVPVHDNYQSFTFTPKDKLLHEASTYTVEGDWSGAAFLLVAGAVAGSVTVEGIYNTSRQADKKIVDAILDAGAIVEVHEDRVSVKKARLKAFVFDATDCPDLFPPLVALAANCTGTTRIHGLKRLKHKESDRGLTLQEEFSKLDVKIDLQDDIMLVHGTGKISVLNQKLNSHHDHRIAMAGVVAALTAEFELHLRNAEAVNKSYPQFYEHMELMGAQLEILDKENMAHHA